MSKKKMKIREIKGLDENGSIRTLNPTEVIHCGKHLGNCEGCIHRLSGDYDTVFERIMEDTPEYCDGYFGDTTITSPDRIFYHEAYFKDDNPLIGDKDYDDIRKEILDLEKKHKYLKNEDSPSKKVGYEPSSKFIKKNAAGVFFWI